MPEELIIDAEVNLKAILNNISESVLLMDTESIILAFNNKSRVNVFRNINEELEVGRSALDYIEKSRKPFFRQMTRRVLRGEVVQFDHQFTRRTGKNVCFQISMNPVYEDYNLTGICVTGRNVTRKKIVEKALIDFERKQKEDEEELKILSMVAKETVNGVAIRDKGQNILWINNAFTKIYGYELNEVAGKNPLIFLQGPETDADVVDWVNKQLIKKDSFVYKIDYYTKDGNKIWVRVEVQPIFDKHGQVMQSFALHTDITEQKRLEDQVELEKIIKLKEITDAVYATQETERSDIGRELHDNINQLLGATHMYIDLAKKDEEKRNFLLDNATTYTLNAIEEIRKLSKTLITPAMEDIALTDIIKDLVEDIKLLHPVKILFTAGEFSEARLSDKFKLNVFRIVQEQVNNILKHARAENIKINIEDSSGKLLISITDDGVGFDTGTRKSGVGLTNIKSRSELYNGYVQLTSEQGVGTTLSITFNKKELG